MLEHSKRFPGLNRDCDHPQAETDQEQQTQPAQRRQPSASRTRLRGNVGGNVNKPFGSKGVEPGNSHLNLDQLPKIVLGIGLTGFRRILRAGQFGGNLSVGEADAGQHLRARKAECYKATIGVGQKIDCLQNLSDLIRPITIKIIDQDNQRPPPERRREQEMTSEFGAIPGPDEVEAAAGPRQTYRYPRVPIGAESTRTRDPGYGSRGVSRRIKRRGERNGHSRPDWAAGALKCPKAGWRSSSLAWLVNRLGRRKEAFWPASDRDGGRPRSVSPAENRQAGLISRCCGPRILFNAVGIRRLDEGQSFCCVLLNNPMVARQRLLSKIEAIRKEHWDGASEYARYLAKLKANPSSSTKGSEQLIRLGLLREAHGWTRIRTAGRDNMADIKDRATLSAAGSA